ncbi:MAG: shikimate kinase [Clostridia bacterium]|nr:shikimate kinase [Clostridia bacterium]
MIKGFSNLKGFVLGEKLPHTFSPQIHSLLADYSYGIKEVAPKDLEHFMLSCEFDFLNVTIPYKKDVIKYLASLSPEAQAIGAVNTVKRMPDGSLRGFNTDYYGFEYTLKKSHLDVSGKKALVLGSGGASMPVKAVLKNLGVSEIITVSRSGEDNYENISKHFDAEIIVNTTPVGMFPNNEAKLIDLRQFNACIGIVDIIYNPQKTALLLEAESLGIKYCGGLSMLVAQAKKAAEIFTDRSIDDTEIERIEKTISYDMTNIVLIGMPSSGKTTIGKIISEKTNKPFFDSDEEFEKCFSVTPAEAIDKLGVDKFRKMEHSVVKELGKKSGCVISTGGGIVTRKENYAPLHQNGVIFFVERDLKKLTSTNRPISKSVGIEKLYSERLPLYIDFSDRRIYNNSTAENAANEIIALAKSGV